MRRMEAVDTHIVRLNRYHFTILTQWADHGVGTFFRQRITICLRFAEI